MSEQTFDGRARASLERLTEIWNDLPEGEIAGDHHSKMTVTGDTMGWHTVDHHGDGRISLSLRAQRGENEMLVASDPNKFFMPPYVANHGYAGVSSTARTSIGTRCARL